MKKLFYIFIAISTFIAGMFSYSLRPLVVPVSLFEIKQNSRLLDGRKVRIKGLLANHDGVITISNLESKNSITAFVGNPEELINNPQVVRLYNELNAVELQDGFYVAEVEMTARVFDPWLSKVQYCFKPALNLEVKDIKQISPIRFISKEEFQKFLPKKHD